MSNSQFSAGQARGQGEAKADQMMGSMSDSRQARKEDVAQFAQETKEQAAGFIQQTSEQMKEMAQDAVDTVKNTLGVGDSNSRR